MLMFDPVRPDQPNTCRLLTWRVVTRLVQGTDDEKGLLVHAGLLDILVPQIRHARAEVGP